jgi:hypothetical protein
MSDHAKAERLIKRANEMLTSEDEPHVMDWIDIVEGLKHELEHYVWLRKECEK